jgi:hypothetical protein
VSPASKQRGSIHRQGMGPTPTGAKARARAGASITRDIELVEFVAPIYVEVPAVHSYRYAVPEPGFVLVNPWDGRIIEVIR